MKGEVVLREVADLLVPLVLLYGLYVIAHGEDGPGGGFQGGVIFAAGLVLHALVHGMGSVRRVISHELTLALACLGLLLYVGLGLVPMAMGGTFLEHGALPFGDPVSGQVAGITVVEVAVGLAVASVMITVFEELYRQ